MGLAGREAGRLRAYGSGGPAGSAAKTVFAALESRRWKTRVLKAALLALLLVAIGIAVCLGAANVPLADLFRALGLPAGPDTPDSLLNQRIILELRLPRVLLAALVGASLALAGATFQALFRNPMADPYVIGVSSGASLGATVAMLLAVDLRFFGIGAVPLFAFVGAVGTVLLVSRLGRVGASVSLSTLLLAGIAVGSFFSAIVSLLVYFAGDRLHQVIFWLMGGFDGANWPYVRLALPYFVLGTAAILVHTRELNILLLGEETAGQLGVDVERAKRWLLSGAALLTATAVSTSGVIGFVGLIVPHVLRMLGGPDHGFLLPASALAGAALMVAADTLARTLIAPTELPVGLITALSGGPFFIYILRSRQRIP
ncbi:MAG: iron chelate uptake ABC transporter family permease subunit [Clostridia bacterium]|nr:iron chelate uptake ABC transporter family permease subunit [Clostridia bacterium]